MSFSFILNSKVMLPMYSFKINFFMIVSNIPIYLDLV